MICLNVNSTMKRIWRAAEILAWTAFFAFAAAVLALRYWLLPEVERHREEIVAAVARALGQPVRIGGVEAGWNGLRPQISLSDVRIDDAEGREVLVLPSVENIVSWRSLLYRELRLRALVIDHPRLIVRRDAAGALYVAGLKLADQPGEHAFTDWVLGQEEIMIRNAEIEWRDEKRAAPPLALAALNLRLRNSGDEHSIGFTARPPAALGASLELRAELAGRTLTDPAAWNGRVYAALGATDLAAWRAWIDYPLDVREGQGALRLWLTLENGAMTEATADVALAQVSARLAQDLPLLELASVQGRLQASALRDGYELGARGLALAAAHGPSLQPTDFQIRWNGTGAAQRGAVTARLVEFEPLARLAESLPLPGELRSLIAELAPRGRLTDAKLEWQGAVAAPQRFSARARFAELALRAWRGAPGFSGLTGNIEATEKKGRIYLAARNADVELPAVFPEPRIVLDTLTGQVDWERQGESGLAVRFSSVSFANQHASGNAYGTYAYTGAGPGTIDLAANLTRADGAHIGKYLPLGRIMGEGVREWLVEAIVAGQASDVRVRLKGDLREFPFTDPAKGQFLVAAHVERGVLNYANGWPRINDIDGELLFERDGMVIVGRSGSILGAKLANVRVSLASLGAPAPHLLVNGEADGPTSEFLRYIESSPVRRMTGGLTDGVRASGHGSLRLKLDLALADLAASKVAGEYEFAGNTVTVHRQLPPIERATGRFGFTESGVSVHGVKGRLFGAPLEITGGSRPGGSIEIAASGRNVKVASLRMLEQPWRDRLSGATSYVATLSVREGATRLRVESNLRGVASALPPPLDKAAGEALPLRVEVMPGDGGARDRISLTLGRRAAAEFLRRRQGESMAVQRAAILITPQAGQPVRLPERPGTLLYGALEALDLDPWLALLPTSGSAMSGAAVDLSIATLDAYGKRLHGVKVRAGADAAGWSASVVADELSGDLSYRGERGLVARLDHLSIPQDTPGSKRERLARPADLPALDLVAARFNLSGKELGRLELVASRAHDDWRIDTLSMANPDATLRASGLWKNGAGGAPSRSSLEFELDASNAGEFLARVGYPKVVKGAKANLQGSLSWQGKPASIDFASLGGELKLQADDGQFLEIEPGLGKLISLMSLQALPRRVALDFRDVFSKGFQFDHIGAEARVEDGLMGIKEFKMRGSAAEVQMTGEVDLARETQNLNVRVVPGLGDSAATALVIVNPVAGVAAAIAQRVLKNPLGQIFAYDYAVTGSWSDPKVEKVSAAQPPQETSTP
jgi:uncharacterized protein (TIGR02099 family)